MQVSNRAAVPCLIAHGATACTDLTGFGLLGHLVEMTAPSGVDAELELVRACRCSTARPKPPQPASSVRCNRPTCACAAPCAIRKKRRRTRNYPLLFDPQTAGGLLASVPAEAADACLAALRDAGYPQRVAHRPRPAAGRGAGTDTADRLN